MMPMNQGVQIAIIVIIVGFAIIIGSYIAIAIVLTKLNRKMFGKGSVMAWLPIANMYLLGKLTINKIVGWVLVFTWLLSTNFHYVANGVKLNYSILPRGIAFCVAVFYNIAVFGLFIYAIIKYLNLKKIDKEIKLTNDENQNSMQNNTENLNQQVIPANNIASINMNENIQDPILGQTINNDQNQVNFNNSVVNPIPEFVQEPVNNNLNQFNQQTEIPAYENVEESFNQPIMGNNDVFNSSVQEPVQSFQQVPSNRNETIQDPINPIMNNVLEPVSLIDEESTENKNKQNNYQ
ncbi:MAG: hypothetical protein RR847_00815 [Bacilli bacterium]